MAADAAQRKTQTPNAPLLSTKAAAEKMCIAPQTLRRWRCERIGPDCVHLSARKVVYRPEDVDRYIADRIRFTPQRAA